MRNGRRIFRRQEYYVNFILRKRRQIFAFAARTGPEGKKNILKLQENALWKTLWKVWITLRRRFLWKTLCKSPPRPEAVEGLLTNAPENRGNMGKPGRKSPAKPFGLSRRFPWIRQKPTKCSKKICRISCLNTRRNRKQEGRALMEGRKRTPGFSPYDSRRFPLPFRPGGLTPPKAAASARPSRPPCSGRCFSRHRAWRPRCPDSRSRRCPPGGPP